MDSLTFWGVYLAIAVLWAAINLWVAARVWLYREPTPSGRGLGLPGSLSVWLWNCYLMAGLAIGVLYRPFGLPFGIQLAAGWRFLGLLAALAGAALALGGMFEFRSLARISALDESRLVTTGVYARVRHPQHAGLLAAVFGLAIAYQTSVGLLAAVVFLFWSLVQTRLEERRLIVLFGDEARRYIAAVPRYLPRWAGYQDENTMEG